MRVDLTNYIPTQERIVTFWERYPNGRIVTMLASDPDGWDICRYRAEIYADREDERPIATGYAFERAGQGMANQTSHEENCETSAIGRALANLGFATSHTNRPSREEMAKVDRMYEEATGANTAPPQPRQPEPSRISATRRPMAPPDAQQPPMQEGAPKGLYYEIEGGYHVPPDVSQLHGITKMDPLNAYLRSNGFDGGMKGEVITELSQTFGVEIKSGRGVNQYGEPDVFPGELYNLAYEHITTPEPPADGAPTEAFDEVPF